MSCLENDRCLLRCGVGHYAGGRGKCQRATVAPFTKRISEKNEDLPLKTKRAPGAPAPPRWNASSARVFGCRFRTVMSEERPDSSVSQLEARRSKSRWPAGCISLPQHRTHIARPASLKLLSPLKQRIYSTTFPAGRMFLPSRFGPESPRSSRASSARACSRFTTSGCWAATFVVSPISLSRLKSSRPISFVAYLPGLALPPAGSGLV